MCVMKQLPALMTFQLHTAMVQSDAGSVMIIDFCIVQFNAFDITYRYWRLPEQI